jgi:NTE family protein
MAELHTALADGLSAAETHSALARLFVGDKASPEVVWFSLPGGRTLYTAGEEPDRLYLVRAGRLGVIRKGENGESQFLGVIKPGEPAGEMALIAGTPHSATVVAMRDSEVLALPRRAFFAAARRDPALMAELARLMIVRARQPVSAAGMAAPRVLGFIGAAEGPSVRPLVEKIERSLQSLGYSVAVLGAEAEHAPTEWFSTVEQRHDFVLFSADRGEEGWIHLCARQVDRLLLLGRSEQAPPFEPSAFAGRAMHEHRLIDLLLIHPATASRPAGATAWLEAGPFTRHFNLREGSAEDAERIARTLCGASVGLVLSGGGARAYAHIGAIRALREAGTPIDFLGGTSMGAIIAAGVAMEWPDEEIVRRIRDAFVETSPLGDVAFPMIAMTHGRLVRDRLKEHFGEVMIEDLWLPFFCVSSNLTSGEPFIHERGKLRRALRASASLPGIMPPQVVDGAVLVDGAVTNNLPVDIMRRWHRGAVVGVDVAEEGSLRPPDIERPPSMWRWLASGQWRRGPPIVSLLIRAATLSSARPIEELARYTDLLVTPMIDGVGLQDWKAFDPAVEAGYQATVAALHTLKRPLTQLHGPGVHDDEDLEMRL